MHQTNSAYFIDLFYFIEKGNYVEMSPTKFTYIFNFYYHSSTYCIRALNSHRIAFLSFCDISIVIYWSVL